MLLSGNAYPGFNGFGFSLNASETSWLTTRGIEYIEAQGDQPWLCHLSYIKPHWPYLVPAPYNDMYSPADLPPHVER